ncbi:MAG TPA: FAD-dependent oxidoreductase [Ornithinibacter sp.]|nr:FAD-dependent oxidoreductase [Ornithinibacter sp.]
MRVLVIGGGVAGPAVALAAANLGMDVTVLERRAVANRHEGSWITVAPNGLDALDALGVLDRVRSVGHPSRLNRLFGATGRHLGDVALGTPLDDGSVALTMKRSALAVELVDAARAVGARVRLGARVVTTADHGNEVEATLEDGTTLRADVLVGADGVHSRVRRALDPAAPPARYVGLTNFGGLSTSSPVAGELEPEAWHFVFGRRSFFGAHPLPTGDVVWFVNVPRGEISAAERAVTTGDQWLSWLADLVADDAGPASRLVADGILELAGDNTYDLPHVPTWWRGSTVIVGDAAHAPSPSSGQGAAIALEDAVVLARALGRHGRAGLPAYEQARRTRVEAVVRAGARSSSAKIPGRVGRVVQEAALRAVFGSGLAARSTAALTAHRLGPAPVDVRRD